MSELRLNPFDLTKSDEWFGEFISLDGTPAGTITETDLAEVLHHGSTDPYDWDGTEAAVLQLKDGRLVAYETNWGPTGNGFYCDAYGGDANLYFARDLNLLVKTALTDHGRRLCGIPEEGLAP